MNDDYKLIFFPGGWNFEDKDGVTSTKIGNCTLMQYTDLKDKNGKEIYEGDLIVITEIDDYPLLPTLVEWKGNGFWVNRLDTWGSQWFPVGDMCEVIGNIYENPELMK